MNSKDKKKNKTPTTRGDSLLRSTNEEISSTMISCTITIKEKDNGEFVHEEILDALPTQTSNKPQTFVVRSAEDFVSDSDPNYLKLGYPDLLPFGRGGFGETRKIPISKKRLVAYYANLSTRKFRFASVRLHSSDTILQQSYG